MKTSITTTTIIETSGEKLSATTFVYNGVEYTIPNDEHFLENLLEILNQDSAENPECD